MLVVCFQDAIESCPPLTTKFMKLVATYSEADPFTIEEVTMDHPVRCLVMTCHILSAHWSSPDPMLF
jgi:hypothetical protein